MPIKIPSPFAGTGMARSSMWVPWRSMRGTMKSHSSWPFLFGILFSICPNAWAQLDAPLIEVFTINRRPVRFLKLFEERLIISETCRTSGTNLKCSAREASLKATYKLLSPELLRDGKNPGSTLCLQMKGNVIFAEDDQQNQRSFCGFPDGSMIDCGSLHFYARMNDQSAEKRATPPPAPKGR